MRDKIKDYLAEVDLYSCTDIEDLLGTINYGWNFKDNFLSIANFYGVDVEEGWNAIENHDLNELYNGDIEEYEGWLESEYGLEVIYFEDETYLLDSSDVSYYSEMVTEMEEEEARGGKAYGGLI